MIAFHPVILANGRNQELWPLARNNFPQQFVTPPSKKQSIFQNTVSLFRSIDSARALVVTSEDFRFLVGEQLRGLGVQVSQIILEPELRSNAASICAAAMSLEQHDPRAVMVVIPVDQIIENASNFRKSIDIAVDFAESGHLVAIGAEAQNALECYGYFQLGWPHEEESVGKFIKLLPNLCESNQDGRYLRATQIYAFTAEAILNAFQRYAKDVFEPVKSAFAEAKSDNDFIRMGQSYKNAKNIDFNSAVMQHVAGIVIKADCKFTPAKYWTDVYNFEQKDSDGNSVRGKAISVNCKNSLLLSEDLNCQMVGIGLKNIAAISTGDAVLVANMNEIGSLKEALRTMKTSKVQQIVDFSQTSRPWGHFETLSKRSRFRVKSIVVKPGQKLSLQSHVHRAEHWVVVEGTAKVTLGDKVRIFSENQSVYIALGEKHRLENPGLVDLHIIEVQTGGYLEEDDIVRYSDDYARV